MLRCLIIEDEPLAQQVIAKYIAQTPQLHLSGICNNALEAFEALQQHPVEVLFLDIKMPRISGIDFIKALKNPPSVIFTTAYNEYAAESYELEAVDYLMKPVTYERFNQSINKLLKVRVADKLEKVPDYLYIKVDGKLVKVHHAALQYVEARKDYLKMVTGEKVLFTHMTMKTLEKLLPEEMFIRIHRSYIVAFSFITAIGNTQVEVGQKRMPIGESYKKQVLKVYERLKTK